MRETLARFTTAEIEFLAQNELITIHPKATFGTLHLISDDYGPIRPSNLNCRVPLWLALQLRKSRNCRIVTPDWLCVNHLRAVLQNEATSKDDFFAVPFYYFEIATLLLEGASEDVPNAAEIRILIQTLREIRLAKIKAGLTMIDGGPLKLNNITHMEVNEIRPFLFGTLHLFSQLSQAEAEETLARSYGGRAAKMAHSHSAAVGPLDLFSNSAIVSGGSPSDHNHNNFTQPPHSSAADASDTLFSFSHLE